MKVRVPIFAKIVTLFLANVLVLGLGLAWVLHQGWGMTALPAFRSDKLERVGGALFTQLEQTSINDWDVLLAEASKEHRVTFYLYSSDGPQLAGPEDFLPGNVHNEVIERELGPPPLNGGPLPPRGVSAIPRLSDDARPVLSATSGYWSFLRGDLTHAEGSGKVALVTRSDSPTGHGFYADTDGIYWIIAGALVISVLVWLPFIHSATRSLRRMQSTAGRLARGDFTARAEDRRRDELGALGQSVNHMADQIGALVDGQKRLLGDIAHELSSPIARMQAIIGILEISDTPKRQGYLVRLDEELQQMGLLVQELLSVSKANLRRSIELRPVHLRLQIQRVIERERQNGEQIVVTVPEDTVVISEPELLSRAIGNVLRNAIRYAGKAGPIEINSTLRGDETIITITDYGPGVPEDSLPRLFDAFYRPDIARTRETGGNGLGLSIVKSCIEATHGSVRAHNGPRGGLVVELTQTSA
jgi:two-component system, OmpR family, sensor histidine kinase CpxA